MKGCCHKRQETHWCISKGLSVLSKKTDVKPKHSKWTDTESKPYLISIRLVSDDHVNRTYSALRMLLFTVLLVRLSGISLID
jgi:hypothetical protein